MAKKKKNRDDEHRGRIQVQGPDMNPERSRKWSQPTPRLRKDAVRNLQELKDECTSAQLERRTQAFAKARRFIENAYPAGVRPPCRPTFQNRNLPRELRSARVDIEVLAGLAFV